MTSVQDDEKNDQLFLLIIDKCVYVVKDIIKSLKSTLLDELQIFLSTGVIDEKKTEITRKNYVDELFEIEKIIHIEMNKIIHTSLLKCLNNAMGHLNIDLFLDNFFIISSILKSHGDEFNYVYTKFQNEYIFHYFEKKEKKIKDGIECEDWTAFQTVPTNFQGIADAVSNFDLNEIKKLEVSEIIKFFEEKSPNDEDGKSTIEINKIKFKLMPITLEVIKVTYDSLKMLSLFDITMFQNIINNLTNLYTQFASMNKEIILDGNGHLETLSQNEVSITCANISILKNIVLCLMQNDKSNILSQSTNQIAIINFNDLLKLLDNLIHTCKCRISDLIDSKCISVALEELSEIKLPNYPIAEGEVPINQYALTLVKLLKAIYHSMQNAFDNSYIVSTVNENLKKFFDRFEKFIFSGEKIENENCLKQ
jgi:hypothetical protein